MGFGGIGVDVGIGVTVGGTRVGVRETATVASDVSAGLTVDVPSGTFSRGGLEVWLHALKAMLKATKIADTRRAGLWLIFDCRSFVIPSSFVVLFGVWLNDAGVFAAHLFGALCTALRGDGFRLFAAPARDLGVVAVQ